jgi:hypothetical protein
MKNYQIVDEKVSIENYCTHFVVNFCLAHNLQN